MLTGSMSFILTSQCYRYETDVLPVKEKWLDILYRQSILNNFWICGSVYQGEQVSYSYRC